MSSRPRRTSSASSTESAYVRRSSSSSTVAASRGTAGAEPDGTGSPASSAQELDSNVRPGAAESEANDDIASSAAIMLPARAQSAAGDLLLKQSVDGLVMSPALYRRRMDEGLTQPGKSGAFPARNSTPPPPAAGGLKERPVLNSRTSSRKVSGAFAKDDRGFAAPAAAGVTASAAAVGADAPTIATTAASAGTGAGRPQPSRRGALTRQRSSTWDERGTIAQAEKEATEEGARTGGSATGVRKRGWSLSGAGASNSNGSTGNGKDRRSSPEWEHLDAFQAMGSMFQQELYHEKSSGIVDVLADKLQIPMAIVLVGVLAALAGMLVDLCSSTARIWRINWVAAHSHVPFISLAYGGMSLGLLLLMCAITHYICPCAAGGGVPEMKAVLSGAGRPGLLSPQLVVVKILGVITANAAGLSVGKEGPLIHVTCAMADIVMSTKMFRMVRLNTMQRLEILACACAAGVAATFGSVFGGTLFSVEVTATAYMVKTLPATFLCAVVVAVVFYMSGQGDLFTLISDNTTQAEGFSPADLVAWCVLGVVCGLVGAAFVAVLDFLSKKRNFFTRKDLPNRERKMRIFAFVAICTILVIPSSYMEAVYFSDADLTGPQRYRPLVDRMYEQKLFGVSWRLTNLLLLKVWATIFSVVQPLPVGLFSPVFVIGGMMGRIFGELAHWSDKYVCDLNINFKPWEFALIGSAAFSAGVTRAVSTAVIVFELSGQNHLRLPLGVALMISFFISQRFTKGVYDALMDTNGTPHLQEVTVADRNVPAEDVMIPVESIPCLSLACTGKDAAEVVGRSRSGQVIPVVQSMTDKVLVGVVLWNDLAIALADYHRRGRDGHEKGNKGDGSNNKKDTGRRHIGVEGAGSPTLFAARTAERARTGEAPLGISRTSQEGAWPKLAAVGQALGKRIGWLPRMRLAEPALLEQLDLNRTKEEDEEAVADAESDLPPLGPGIPQEQENEKASLLSGGNNNNFSRVPAIRHDYGSGQATRAALPGLYHDRSGNAAATSNGGNDDRASDKRSSSWSESERAKRAPLRFFLVREGHKFVAVGRTRRKGAWRELPALRTPQGVPIVLDPSPYQVTHTTELSKVDLAFRLLRLENAYVCNAGRLVGVVTRESLQDYMSAREVTPLDECKSILGGFACCMPPSRRDQDSGRYDPAGDDSDDGHGGRNAPEAATNAAAGSAKHGGLPPSSSSSPLRSRQSAASLQDSFRGTADARPGRGRANSPAGDDVSRDGVRGSRGGNRDSDWDPV